VEIVVLLLVLFAVVVVGTAIGSTVLLATAAATTWQRLTRPAQLVAGQRVPLRWRWSPSPVAVLHRRLLCAVQTVEEAWGAIERAREPMPLPHPGPRQSVLGAVTGRRRRPSGPPEDPWAGLRRDVLGLAVLVDQRLVRADALQGQVRSQVLPSLDGAVQEVEALAARFASSVQHRLAAGRHSEPGAPSQDPAVTAIHERLDALDEVVERFGPGGPAAGW